MNFRCDTETALESSKSECTSANSTQALKERDWFKSQRPETFIGSKIDDEKAVRSGYITDYDKQDGLWDVIYNDSSVGRFNKDELRKALSRHKDYDSHKLG